MPFPESPRVIYENNPLTLVICQLRFPAILRIASDQPSDFQDRIRALYPIYRQKTIPSLPPQVLEVIANLPFPPPPEGPSHEFVSEDNSRQITLTRDFIAITDSNYQGWEHFLQAIEMAKQALEDYYNPSFYTRLGLRYRDVIDPLRIEPAPSSFASLLTPAIAGILASEQLAPHIKQTSSQALIELPDMPDAFLQLRAGLVDVDTDPHQAYEIDADFFISGRSSSDDVLPILRRFNRAAGNFFRWAITSALHEALHPRPMDNPS